MDGPIVICARNFSPELILHLSQLAAQSPVPSNNSLARELCDVLAWRSPNGRPALSSAEVAIRKLHKLGHLQLPSPHVRKKANRLRRSSNPLPPLERVPKHVDQLTGLNLQQLGDSNDPLHLIWNDLIIEQHPCSDAPLAGPRLRYLIGSDQGWLGAMSFSPASFVLGARDKWIGWSTQARLNNLNQVVGLSRFLIRTEVRCANLASKVLSMALDCLPGHWLARYGTEPVLVETFVDRSNFNGRSLRAANWLRIGESTGRGRLGPKEPTKTIKDIWVFELKDKARQKLQKESPPPITPQSILQSISQQDWWANELSRLDLGDKRLDKRAQTILQARWEQPQASFYGTFHCWAPAKAAYGFIENRDASISFATLLASHSESTQSRMAAEPVVLLPQDTTTLNYSGLRQTKGLGPLGQEKGRGLWLHSLLAFRPDGIPLGVLGADCWARPNKPQKTSQRNGKSIDRKESIRWLDSFQRAATAARRMPQTQLVVLTDREGDLYELHDAVQIGPDNLHALIRAQHDRNLDCHKKLWEFMGALPPGQVRQMEVPRRAGRAKRTATVEMRWSEVNIGAPLTGHKRGWPTLCLWAVLVREINAPQGVEPLEWMLLSDMPISNAEQAWEKVQWYRCRWGIEEWHRALKNGCCVEEREFKTADHLQRVLAFDMIVAWRVLLCVKLGRQMPNLPATAIYTQDELEVLRLVFKKRFPQAAPHCGRPTL